MNHFTSPPPPLGKLTTLIVAALVALALAAPATAQTTVTSNGRIGDTACLDKKQHQSDILPITNVAPTAANFTIPAITWGQYTGRLGDMTAPAEITLRAGVFNARDDTFANGGKLATISSGTPNYAGQSGNLSAGLLAKTNYYVEVYTNASGSIPRQVFARSCFMTGGTYTMNVDPDSTQGRNSGCFTISPLTIQHVRNCWCGRKTTLPLFRSTQDNTDWHNMWGCR